MRALVLELDALPTLREAVGAADVDLPAAATLAELAGVDAVRLGVSVDLKPVREEDLQDMRRAARRLELRMPPSETLLAVALATRPDRVLLAADAREGRAAAAPIDLRVDLLAHSENLYGPIYDMSSGATIFSIGFRF